jgi:hypothetical protein
MVIARQKGVEIPAVRLARVVKKLQEPVPAIGETLRWMMLAIAR